METYANVVQYAIPVFLLLIALEAWIGARMGVVTNRAFDTISSLSSGLTNVMKDVLGLVVVIVSYDWLVQHLALWDPGKAWYVFVIAFVAKDFAGYWTHRLEHEINLFWNRHIIHHSSEEFNLSCALRQSISVFFSIFIFLYIPMAILGVSAEVVAIVAPLHLFAQFWYHTRLIGKMGWLEHVIVTPSHHRVHHAINDKYLDKNYSQIFIWWDKWFGTFQEELDDEPPVYGVKRQVATWNPIKINFQHLWLLVKDAVMTRSWWDKLTIWFKPTGYRPGDREVQDPIAYVKEVHKQVKYRTDAAPLVQMWAWIMLVLHLMAFLHLLQWIGDVPFGYLVTYAMMITISIYAYTSMMDGTGDSILASMLIMVFLSFAKPWISHETVATFWPTCMILCLGMLVIHSLIFFKAKPIQNEVLNPSFR